MSLPAREFDHVRLLRYAITGARWQLDRTDGQLQRQETQRTQRRLPPPERPVLLARREKTLRRRYRRDRWSELSRTHPRVRRPQVQPPVHGGKLVDVLDVRQRSRREDRVI